MSFKLPFQGDNCCFSVPGALPRAILSCPFRARKGTMFLRWIPPSLVESIFLKNRVASGRPHRVRPYNFNKKIRLLLSPRLRRRGLGGGLARKKRTTPPFGHPALEEEGSLRISNCIRLWLRGHGRLRGICLRRLLVF